MSVFPEHVQPLVQPVDQAARELISRGGLGRTLFVEAGAGSGKTTQLVDRIANLVLHDGVRLASIAAITFTEAAAAELQSRIRVLFEKRFMQTDDPAERERCRVAIAEADMAAISTLHGFASRLLGEFAVDAELPPRIRVLDEVTSQLAHEDRWNRFIDRLYDDTDNEALLVRAALVGVALEPRYSGQATLKDVAAELDQNWDRIAPLAEAEPRSIASIDFGPFDRAVDQVRQLPPLCTDPTDKFYVHLTTKVLLQMEAIAAVDDPNRKLQLLASVEPWTGGIGGKKDAWGGDVKACKELVKAVNEEVAEVVATAADTVLQHLLKVTAIEVLRSAQARRDDGGLEFHDLLVLARELLRTSGNARSELHQRYTHLLLDEFQDTDPIQIELAMLIAATIATDQPEHWSTLAVEPGRLFFVGDPKQSIYRFRRADIDLFLNARDRFGADDSLVRLVTNFRTVEPILAWVNALFAHEMPEEIRGAQPRYEPLVAFRQVQPEIDHRPVLLGGEHPDPKVKAGPLREAEADDVARTITDIAANPEAWPVLDDDTKQWRPAQLSDITILVPTRTSLPYLRAALESSALPYRLATGTLVYDTQEVRDALAAIRAIDDPTDELSLVTTLRSPLYACSDVDLFTFHEAGGRWNLRADVSATVPDDHPVRAALDHLRGLWRDRWWLTPSALLERLLRERRADLLAFGDPRPTEVWRRLRFLVDQARAFEESGGGGLRSFVDWAALQGADGARVHEPLLPETDDDAVKILTIHGSKGLEFAITILSGMTTKAGGARRGVSVIWDETGPPEVSLRKGLATLNHEPRADLEHEMDAHEKLRLLYVATTRARDHLIVSCHHKQAKDPLDTYAGRMWTYFADHGELWRRLPGDAVPVEPVEPDQMRLDLFEREPEAQPTEESGEGSAEPAVVPAVALDADEVAAIERERDAWISARELLLAPQRLPSVTSATAIAREALLAPPVVLDEHGAIIPNADESGDADDDGRSDDRSDDRSDSVNDAIVRTRRRGRAGSAIGRAVHATLQVLDLDDPHAINEQARRQCDIEAIPDLVDTVGALVRSALESDAVRLAARGTHYKELFVAAPVGDRVIEGYIDLLIETAEGLVIIDYKTDSVGSEAEIDSKLASYELQGASYAVVLEAVTGQPVIDCRFVFCKQRGAIERSVRDLPAAMAQVRHAMGAR